MNHGNLLFGIQADDIDRAAKFYQTDSARKFSKSPGAPIEYLDIETGASSGSLLQRPGRTPPPEHGTNACVCSMRCENFGEAAEKITASGGRVALEEFPVPGRCWQGHFIDPEGNTFGIFEVVEKAGS